MSTLVIRKNYCRLGIFLLRVVVYIEKLCGHESNRMNNDTLFTVCGTKSSSAQSLVIMLKMNPGHQLT